MEEFGLQDFLYVAVLVFAYFVLGWEFAEFMGRVLGAPPRRRH
jgi:hypothetical protein